MTFAFRKCILCFIGTRKPFGVSKENDMFRAMPRTLNLVTLRCNCPLYDSELYPQLSQIYRNLVSMNQPKAKATVGVLVGLNVDLVTSIRF